MDFVGIAFFDTEAETPVADGLAEHLYCEAESFPDYTRSPEGMTCVSTASRHYFGASMS